MRLLDSMLEYNEYFVRFEEYQKYKTEDKYPTKRVVMFTCMDTRLVELATKSLNLSSGDVKVVKNAGAILTHPFGSIMRSLIIAVYMLKADEIIVMGHHDCGMQNIDTNLIMEAHDVNMITKHPLIPKDVPVHGLVINPENGKVELVVNGYNNLRK